MNKILFFLLILISNLSLSQNIYFADSIFKKALLAHSPIIDLNNDGEIQVSEAEIVTDLSIVQKGIKNVQEIQYFKNLTDLNLNNNQLSSLRIENLLHLENLYCVSNKLETLELKNLPSLIGVYFGANQLKNPILYNLPNLTSLNCFNNLIEEIDLSNWKYLKYLNLSNNKIKHIDLSQNVELVQFNLSENVIKKIDISNNLKLDLKILYFDAFVEIFFEGKKIHN